MSVLAAEGEFGGADELGLGEVGVVGGRRLDLICRAWSRTARAEG